MPRRIYDISLPLSPDLPVWPGEERFRLSREKEMARDRVNVSAFCMGSHLGTHLDAPLHYIADGASLDLVPLETFLGPARVVELADAGNISGPAVRKLAPQKGERLLFKTANSRLWHSGQRDFTDEYTAFSLEAAQELAAAGVALVGIDYLSVEAYDAPGNPVHRALLGTGIICAEGLNLGAVAPGEYQMACLPLKLVGAEGAPARVLLWRDE